jgi:hypothetical protein
MLVGFLFLKVPVSFKVTAHKGGEIQQVGFGTTGETWITLAPYFLPTLPLALIAVGFFVEIDDSYFFGALGWLTVFHIVTNWSESSFRQPDLQKAGIAVSLFVAPDPKQIRAAADVGADFIELHTGHYANCRTEETAAAEIRRQADAARLAHKLGLRVNAGHGLNYQNTPGIFAVPHLETLNTGHAIIARSVFVGLRQAVQEMLALMAPYRG